MSSVPSQGLLGVLEERRSELLRFLTARTGSAAEAEDLLSELWIKVSAIPSGPVLHPRAYLFRMANNLVLDRLREARRRERRESHWVSAEHGVNSPASEVTDPAPTPEQMLISRDEARRLAAAVAQLPPGSQRVLRLHKLQGLSHGEVAEHLGITKSAVEKHMAVAMSHLRRLLQAEGPVGSRRLASNEGGPGEDGTGLES